MVSSDPVADMLSRIRNALMVNKDSVSAPYSKFKEQIVKVLKMNNFILSYTINGEGVDKSILIQLQSESEPARISTIDRLSKPGRRMYSKGIKVPKSQSGRGIVIVSTSKGLMTDNEARDQKIGGELICRVS